MTVKELIEALSTLDGDALVLTRDPTDYGFVPVEADDVFAVDVVRSAEEHEHYVRAETTRHASRPRIKAVLL